MRADFLGFAHSLNTAPTHRSVSWERWKERAASGRIPNRGMPPARVGLSRAAVSFVCLSGLGPPSISCICTPLKIGRSAPLCTVRAGTPRFVLFTAAVHKMGGISGSLLVGPRVAFCSGGWLVGVVCFYYYVCKVRASRLEGAPDVLFRRD